jgi:hypothetical protein
MLYDNVQPVALLEIIHCDICLDETSGESIKTIFGDNSSECMKEIILQKNSENVSQNFFLPYFGGRRERCVGGRGIAFQQVLRRFNPMNATQVLTCE